MLDTNYGEDFCVADNFSPEFVSRLMEAGFLVMSAKYEDFEDGCFLLPKLHLVRSALFFENLHIKKSIRRLLPRYELQPNAEFDRIVDLCVEKHGSDWLTSPLIECIRKIRDTSPSPGVLAPSANAYPASFALYRNGKLVAGEFGVVCGRVYTSYSGYYDEDNAGTVQIILTAQYLEKNGFSFFDLGMPLDYKTGLGAVNISTHEFVELFRGAVRENHGAADRGAVSQDVFQPLFFPKI
jgi:Leu/Phe-tRNA-protein transferase